MVAKRKALVKSAENIFGRPNTKMIEKEDADMKEESEEEDDEETEELSEQEILANKKKEEKQQEKETVAKREKELKSMYVEDLKKLVESKSLQVGKRDDMIKAIIKVEAKERAEVREHEVTIRAIVNKKKDELEALSAPELKDLCAEKGLKGTMPKQDRIETLLKLWLEADGINKARLQEACEARESELASMDKQALKKLCDKAGIEAFLKDVMVDRIVKCETEMGKFLRPVTNPEKDMTDAVPKNDSKTDLVHTLLAKQMEEKEIAQKKADETAQLKQKIKDLSDKSIDQLQKLLKKKGLEVSGKKNEMVKALCDAAVQEDAAAARKTELQSMGAEALTQLLTRRGLTTSKSKNSMVETLLSYEANIQKELKVYEAKMVEVVAKRKDELQENTGAELKEMCVEKGLAAGVAKEDRVTRLVEAAEKDGELDNILAKVLRCERSRALDAMDKTGLIKLCEDLGIDPLVKEVMIERIISHEAEHGEPVAKKARKTSN